MLIYQYKTDKPFACAQVGVQSRPATHQGKHVHAFSVKQKKIVDYLQVNHGLEPYYIIGGEALRGDVALEAVTQAVEGLVGGAMLKTLREMCKNVGIPVSGKTKVIDMKGALKRAAITDDTLYKKILTKAKAVIDEREELRLKEETEDAGEGSGGQSKDDN